MHYTVYISPSDLANDQSLLLVADVTHAFRRDWEHGSIIPTTHPYHRFNLRWTIQHEDGISYGLFAEKNCSLQITATVDQLTPMILWFQSLVPQHQLIISCDWMDNTSSLRTTITTNRHDLHQIFKRLVRQKRFYTNDWLCAEGQSTLCALQPPNRFYRMYGIHRCSDGRINCVIGTTDAVDPDIHAHQWDQGQWHSFPLASYNGAHIMWRTMLWFRDRLLGWVWDTSRMNTTRLVSYDQEQVVDVRLPIQLAPIFATSGTFLWMMGKHEVWRTRDEASEWEHVISAPEGWRFYSLYCVSDQRLWLTLRPNRGDKGSDRVLCWDSHGLSELAIPADLKRFQKTCVVLETSHQHLWFSASIGGKGIWRWDGHEWQSFHATPTMIDGRQPGLINVCFDQMIEDRQQRIWGLGFNGLSLYQAGVWRTVYVTIAPLGAESVIALSEKITTMHYDRNREQLLLGMVGGVLVIVDLTQDLINYQALREENPLTVICGVMLDDIQCSS